MDQPECQYDDAIENKWGGVICDSSIEIRRVVFYNYLPASFEGMEFRAVKYDESFLDSMSEDEQTSFFEDKSNYASYFWKDGSRPSASWAVPFITGKRYKVHWQEGLDFETMHYEVSEKWTKDDLDVYLVHNFTDVREAVNFTVNGDIDQQIANDTFMAGLPMNNGQNLVLNDTETREIHWVVNGKPSNRLIKMEGIRCLGGCLDSIEEVEIDDTIRYWSDLEDWDGTIDELPKEGDYVEI
mmetsp:Transcript_58622/g.80476  ORF Transcript_58622/g.80476 Transcript_58622/m.80476 type:complete len:241 (+) Transcript_58622:2328-3050(+)